MRTRRQSSRIAPYLRARPGRRRLRAHHQVVAQLIARFVLGRGNQFRQEIVVDDRGAAVKILQLAIHLAQHMAGMRIERSIKLAPARPLALDLRQHAHPASLAEENYKAFANGA